LLTLEIGGIVQQVQRQPYANISHGNSPIGRDLVISKKKKEEEDEE